MKYIATFYSHFGAIRYKKICGEKGIAAKVMPVPRKLSSSCGTCVSYEDENYIIDNNYIEEIEQIVIVSDDGYEQVYVADN